MKNYRCKKSCFQKKAAFKYPGPGSNRHELLHWCLRPTRLPIPPPGHILISGAQIYQLGLDYTNFISSTTEQIYYPQIFRILIFILLLILQLLIYPKWYER